MKTVSHADAFDWVSTLPDRSVRLLLTDPPYSKIVSDTWDNQWKTPQDYARWFCTLLRKVKPKLLPDASVVIFGGIGKPHHRAFLHLLLRIEEKNLLHVRDWVTWKKRRAYGTKDRMLFLREEVLFCTMHPKDYVFHIPLTNELRGYDGFNAKYKAKSPYKRVGNVWTDIPELFKTRREAEKPVPLMVRWIEMLSNPEDIVIDPFVGSGTTAVAAHQTGRKFYGCDQDREAVLMTRERLRAL